MDFNHIINRMAKSEKLLAPTVAPIEVLSPQRMQNLAFFENLRDEA